MSYFEKYLTKYCFSTFYIFNEIDMWVKKELTIFQLSFFIFKVAVQISPSNQK